MCATNEKVVSMKEKNKTEQSTKYKEAQWRGLNLLLLAIILCFKKKKTSVTMTNVI